MSSLTYRCSCCGSEKLIKATYRCKSGGPYASSEIRIGIHKPSNGIIDYLLNPPSTSITVENARVCTDCGNVMPYIDTNKLK